MRGLYRILALLHFLFCANSYSQENYIPYYHKVNEADNLNKLHLYAQADSIYALAFNMVSVNHPDNLVDAAANACSLDSLQKAYTYLIEAATTGYPLRQIRKKESLKPFIKSDYWRKCKKEYKKELAAYKSSLDMDLVKRINDIYKDDQKYRGRILFQNMEKQKKLDAHNLDKIKALQNEYGKIPGIKEVGYGGMMLLYVTFRHVEDKYAMDTLGPQLISQSKHGDFYPRMGPAVIDYKAFMQVSSKQHYMTCQIYGTQVIISPNTRTRVIIPVEDIESIDNIRRSLGLAKLGSDTKAVYDEKLIKEECGKSFEFCD